MTQGLALLGVLTAGFFGSWGLTPLFGWLSRRFGVIDRPSVRKVHTRPTPKGGGGAIVFGLAIAAGGGVALWPGLRTPEWYLFLLSCGGIAVVGWVDDKLELTPWQKLLGTTVPALVWNFAIAPKTYWGVFQALLGTGFVVFALNAVNLLDGLDGLAAGYGAISALALGLTAWSQGEIGVAVCGFALAGAASGFLPHNFQPAWIFMGDTGSLTIGFALAALGLRFSGGIVSDDLPVVLAVMALPFFDTLIAVVRRRMHNRPIFAADKSHTYNLLVRRGFSVRQTVLLCYTCAMFMGGLGFWYTTASSWLVRSGVVGLGAGLLLALSVKFDFLQVDPEVVERNRSVQVDHPLKEG